MNADPVLLAPLVLTAGTAITAMVVIGAYRHHALTVFVTFTGLVCAVAAVPFAWSGQPGQFRMLLLLDHYALLYQALFLLVTATVMLLSYGYLDRHERHREEFYVLLLLATLGAMVLVASSHFASFFLGLELLSISLYSLIALRQNRALGIEAALKYLVLSGTSSAFLLFGMALVYAQLGTMQLAELASAMSRAPVGDLLPGMGLISIGIGFKLALVPFHLWTPDVYQGAPAPVAAFIATVSKGAVLALLIRYLGVLQLEREPAVAQLLAWAAVLSMTAGNLLALQQPNLKRLLAYSSIAQMGYVLIAALLNPPLAALVATFYLITYYVAIIAAFGVVTLVAVHGDELEDLGLYEGLAWRRPWLAGVLTAAMLSLAGLPLTAGFLGKFVLVTGGVGGKLWVLMIALVINSAIGLYYYLRVVSALYRKRPERTATALPAADGVAVAVAGASLAALTVLIVALGVYPTPLLSLIGEVVARFPQ